MRVTGVDGASLLVEELDLLDGTPVLDIKPYVPLFDPRETTRTGWFDEAGRAGLRAAGRRALRAPGSTGGVHGWTRCPVEPGSRLGP